MKNTISIEKLRVFLFMAIIICASSAAFGQRTPSFVDKTPMITSRVFTTNIEGNERERVFAFWADAGEVVLKIKVTAKNDNAGVYLHFLDKQDEELTDFVLAQGAVGTPTETITTKMNFDKKTLVYLKIKEMAFGSREKYRGTLQIAFGGSFIEGKKARN